MTRVDLADVNLNLLVALDSLLHECSVTGAARRSRVTPSAMSHSLAELRELLGDPLLVRTGGGMALTPRAEILLAPLHRVLLDAQSIIRNQVAFDPLTADRNFVIAAPDFLTTLLLPPLVAAIATEAPRVTLELVPSVRRGNAWLLETGELDLALGAVVDDAPGIRRMDLCTEGFTCAAREGTPDDRWQPDARPIRRHAAPAHHPRRQRAPHLGRRSAREARKAPSGGGAGAALHGGAAGGGPHGPVVDGSQHADSVLRRARAAADPEASPLPCRPIPRSSTGTSGSIPILRTVGSGS